ncbi:MAG: hypothetical protein ACYDD6_05530 [Acidimicrobiales bacterium]
MRGLLRAEALKLRSIWSTWVLLGITVVVVGGLSVVVGFAPHHRDIAALLFPARGSAAWFDTVFSTMGIATDLALVLGVIAVTGEYRHKTVTPTYLVEPRRGRVTAAKLVVCAAGGLVVAAAAGAISLALGFAVVGSGIGDTGRMLTEFRHVFPGVAAAAMLFAVYGVGLGALLKNQVVALVVGLGVSTIVEPIIDGTLPSVGRWLPSQAAQALASVTARASGFGGSLVHLITWWQGGLVLLAYGVVLAAAGSFTTLRADVT